MSLSLWQAASKGSPLQRVEAPLPEPGPEEALLEVLHCGLCHSDISMLDNAWGASGYPLVPGHEVVGRVVAVGDGVNPDLIGQLRGLGWISGSCRHCRWCLGGGGQPLRRPGGNRGGPPGRLCQPCSWASRLASANPRGHQSRRCWPRPSHFYPSRKGHSGLQVSNWSRLRNSPRS